VVPFELTSLKGLEEKCAFLKNDIELGDHALILPWPEDPQYTFEQLGMEEPADRAKVIPFVALGMFPSVNHHSLHSTIATARSSPSVHEGASLPFIEEDIYGLLSHPALFPD
jgi:hypothetical protein